MGNRARKRLVAKHAPKVMESAMVKEARSIAHTQGLRAFAWRRVALWLIVGVFVLMVIVGGLVVHLFKIMQTCKV